MGEKQYRVKKEVSLEDKAYKQNKGDGVVLHSLGVKLIIATRLGHGHFADYHEIFGLEVGEKHCKLMWTKRSSHNSTCFPVQIRDHKQGVKLFVPSPKKKQLNPQGNTWGRQKGICSFVG